MSSANLVSLILIPETDYGVLPPLATVTAGTIRYTSESLSGTPTVTESEEIRADRSSGGQVVVGSEIGGDISGELSKDAVIEQLMQGAMMNTWSTNDLTVGKEVVSFTLGKAYQDVVHAASTPNYHGQSYLGSVISTMTISMSYGEIATFAFTTMANGHSLDDPSLEQQVDTAGGTINPPSTTQPLNATIDNVTLEVDDVQVTFCVESIEMVIDNNLTPQNCLGKVEPSKYNLGTAGVTLSMTMYNSDEAYDAFMDKRWTQTPVKVSFDAQNADGGYLFTLPAVQLVFPDPASTGRNTQVMIEATGVGKSGAAGESPLTITRILAP